MKNYLIRLQILLILLVFLSPILYLTYKEYRPQLELIRYDQDRVVREQSYPQLQWLSTSGRNIVDQTDNPVILRGVNIAGTTWGKEYEDWNSQAVNYVVTNWGANVIRTRLHQYEYEDNPANFFLKLETQILEPARKSGAYVILHPWFGENESLPNANGIKMWQAVAKRYESDPHILYDLFAEPRDITTQELVHAYQTIIPQVRSANPRSLIFVTGLDWGREINSYLKSPLPYDNLVYRTNPYNKDGEFEGLFGKIAEELPVMIGEFGSDDSLTMGESDVQDLLGYADSLGIGWTAWHFSNSGCPCLLTDNSSFTPSPYGLLVKSALSGTTYPYSPPTFDPDPTKTYIYSDFLENGFSDYSWLVETDLASNTRVFAGTHSLSATLHPSGGIYLHSSRLISPADYQTLHLTISTSILDSLSLRFRSESDELSNPITVSDYAKSSDNWTEIVLPTSLINLPAIAGIMIESREELTSPSTIYLDQIYFQR